MSYLTAKDKAEEDMYLYSLGKTPPISMICPSPCSPRLICPPPSLWRRLASWSAPTASSRSGSSPRSIPMSPPRARVRWLWSPTCAAAMARKCWMMST